MKHIILLLFLLLANTAFGQSNKQVQATLDTALTYMENNSLYSHTIDWKQVKAESKKTAQTAESVEDLKSAFEKIINKMGDNHARIFKTADYSLLAHCTDYQNVKYKEKREKDDRTWAIVNDTAARFEYALLENKIGYLKVVGIGPNVNGQKEAERIRAALTHLKKKKVKKWIVDLRYNGGGNINVMLAGLAPLFDTKEVASVQDFNKETIGTAHIQKGNFSYFGHQAYLMPKKPKIRKPKIAILTSRWTASSGELAAIAFKGQKKVRFFGEATGAYTTNTGWEVINNEIALVISTGVFCDRNRVAYHSVVDVDREVTFTVETDTNKDKGIQKAIHWLRK